jgi:hypothetical protein
VASLRNVFALMIVSMSSFFVCRAINANHGGGYSYRLCPSSANATEECFQQHMYKSMVLLLHPRPFPVLRTVAIILLFYFNIFCSLVASDSNRDHAWIQEGNNVGNRKQVL